MIEFMPNDDFDMCCGGRPQVTDDGTNRTAVCGVCGDRLSVGREYPWYTVMIDWNRRQRDKA